MNKKGYINYVDLTQIMERKPRRLLALYEGKPYTGWVKMWAPGLMCHYVDGRLRLKVTFKQYKAYTSKLGRLLYE